MVLLKGRDRHPKNFRFNFEASLSELEKIPSSISSTFLTYYSGYLEERGQKNKQFYRVYRSLRKWCESLASSLPTPLILLLHYYIYNERSIMIFRLDVCALILCSTVFFTYSQCLKITEKSHSILRAKRATFKFCVQILNQKYQKWSIWQVFENATFGRFSNTVYTKSLLCKANIVVCRVALRLLTFTSWLEAWGEEDLFPTTALRPKGSSRVLNSKKSIFTACHDV